MSNVDLRQVRHVTVFPNMRMLTLGDTGVRIIARDGMIGAVAGSCLSLQVTGQVALGAILGATVGAARATLKHVRRVLSHQHKPFVIVPWGILIDDAEGQRALRWSAVSGMQIRFLSSSDGSVHTQVTIETDCESYSGFVHDIVDFGALSGDLTVIATASSSPIALDFLGNQLVEDIEPFAERLIESVRQFLTHEAHRVLPGLGETSYRGGSQVKAIEPNAVVRAIRARLKQKDLTQKTLALHCVLAGELQLTDYLSDLDQLSCHPHPRVSAVARAASARIRSMAIAGEDDSEEHSLLAYFVAPEELDRLRLWALETHWP